jgi:hypothetical protein
MWKANGKNTTLSLFLDSLFPKINIRRSQNAAKKQGSDARFFGNYKVENLRQHKRSLFNCSTFKISTVFK